MIAIQAKASSEGLREPTYSNIIEIWEAMSSEPVMLAVLKQLWSEPGVRDIRAAVAMVKARQKKPSV